MPTYEYTCKACGQHIEVVRSFTDEPLAACPSCGGAVRKVFGNIGISFKGSGFYKNDSRSSTNGSSRSGSGSGGSEGASQAPGGTGSGEGSPGASVPAEAAGTKTASTTEPASTKPAPAKREPAATS